ncbi:amidohydrolase family protein [Nesterenkonia sp. Act20]|uniref:amidohydrolase family protein n=1 Tax=Nesterenkonia sp. Act20 TaxID=1483432 RepID=UPI00350E5780
MSCVLISLPARAPLAVREGMDPAEALKAVTLNPAEVLGVSDRIGSLEPGKDADLALWSGDPLDTRNRVLRTWIDGEQVYTHAED